MQNRILLAAFVLLPLAGGCGSQFAGEWVQESALDRSGAVVPVTAERRLAMQFTPPSTVRVGMYVDASGVVEAGTVTSSAYQTIQNRSVAQFGAYTARVEDGQLIAFIGGEEKGRFRKLTGKSIFPPVVKLPQIVRAAPSLDFAQATEAVARVPRANAPTVAVAE